MSACFHSGFHTLNLERVFEYSFQVRRNEKYDVHRKMFDTMNLGFTKKGILCHITKIELRFAFKRGVLLDLKISDFG